MKINLSLARGLFKDDYNIPHYVELDYADDVSDLFRILEIPAHYQQYVLILINDKKALSYSPLRDGDRVKILRS